MPISYSIGPVVAAAVGTAAAWTVLSLPGAAPASGWVAAAALAAGLGLYGAALKAWLAVTGDSLALVKFEAG